MACLDRKISIGTSNILLTICTIHTSPIVMIAWDCTPVISRQSTFINPPKRPNRPEVLVYHVVDGMVLLELNPIPDSPLLTRNRIKQRIADTSRRMPNKATIGHRWILQTCCTTYLYHLCHSCTCTACQQ